MKQIRCVKGALRIKGASRKNYMNTGITTVLALVNICHNR